MGYSFMRIEKIKSTTGMNGLYKHNYRIMEVPNADKNLTVLNVEEIPLNGKTYNEVFREKIKRLEYYKNHEVHKNAVLALEVVTSFSREDSANIDLNKWQKDNADWLRSNFNSNPEKYGDNVISMMVHYDEVGNVHCHGIVVPVGQNGKLAAREFINGKRKFYELQNSYGELMQKNHNLKRGLHNSRATHADIKHFYAEINSSFYEKNQIPIPASHDTLETYKEKVESYVKDLKGNHLKEIKNLERTFVEKEHKIVAYADKRNDYFKEKVVEYKDKNKIIKKKQNELEHKFGAFEEIKKKLEYVENLTTGIQELPDQEEARKLHAQINELEAFGKKERRKYKKKEETRTGISI